MSDSVRPHRRQPTRLPCPWDSPGKSTGVGCHFLLQCLKVKSESEVATKQQQNQLLGDHNILILWCVIKKPSLSERNMEMHVCALSRVGLFATPWTVAHQAPMSMEFSRQEYWRGLPFPSPGELSNPGTESGSLTLRADSLPPEPPGIPQIVSKPLEAR